jgi:putative membrane protein
MRWIVNWILSAVALLVVARIVPGIYVRGFSSALWAALIIGIVNATLGLLTKIVTFPLTMLTLGLFWLVINGLMLEFATLFAPGFRVSGFWAAFWGALVLSLLNAFMRWLVWPD